MGAVDFQREDANPSTRTQYLRRMSVSVMALGMRFGLRTLIPHRMETS